MKRYNLTPEGIVEDDEGSFVAWSDYKQLDELQEETLKMISAIDEMHRLQQNLLATEEACRQKSKFFKEINCKREMRHWSKKAMLLSRITSELGNILKGKASYKHFGEDAFLNDED